MQISSSLRRFFGAQDMTQGKPMNCLIHFSIPLLIGNLAQQLYNTVDSIIVGKYVGDVALAAVGTAGPILNLMIVLFMGISTGASILTAQLFGAHDRERLTRETGSAITLMILSGIIMTVVGIFLASPLIGLVNPPPDVAEGAVIYLKIIFAGMLGSAAYNILSGILRGMGDSVSPLLFLVIASLLNIVLDLVFVRNLSLGIAGVAYATIIAQGISGMLCLIRLIMMRDQVSLSWKSLIPDRKLTKQLGRLGLPAGVTSAIFSMASIVVQGLTNSMGTIVIATSVAVMRVDGFAMMPNFTFGTAATTFVGQNVGAKRPDRIQQGTKDMLKLALGFATLIVACIIVFGPNLISLFTETPEVVQIGTIGLRWLSLGYIAFAVSQVLQGVMRGWGETAVPMWISIFCTLILRMPLAYLLAYLTRSEQWPNGAPDAIFASLLVSWTVAMLSTVFVYRNGKWRKRADRMLKEEI